MIHQGTNAGIVAHVLMGQHPGFHVRFQWDFRHTNQAFGCFSNKAGQQPNPLREAATRLRDDGAIINLSTSVVGLKLETYGIYAATKAAVETMTAILAKELRGRDITVNAVALGPTATALFLDGKPQDVVERLSKMAPLGRLGTPEDIARAVAFLAGPDGRWINGQTLRTNGGIV